MSGTNWTFLLSAGVFSAALAGMLQGAEPWATWFYPLAWYPTLAAAEALLIRLRGRGFFTADDRFALALAAWSVPFWLFFELLNFRIANWYYVFLPPHPATRWTGIVLSFATVLPAILVSREVLAELGVGRRAQWPRLPVTESLPTLLQAGGLAFFALALAWPRYFFPLIWGAVTLLADPWVYRRDPERSLLGALERGRPQVILQLLAGGLAIGFLWELYNVEARGKWIYTVPGLEELKLFEMPLLGFLGFPVLALDGWAIWNVLVLGRLAAEPSPATAPVPRLRRGTAAALSLPVLAACVGILLGMERWTISSTRPELSDLAGSAAPMLATAGYDAFALAEADPRGLARAAGVPWLVAQDWVRTARLATHRGIGTEHARRLEAVGVASVEVLAEAEPAALIRRLEEAGWRDVRPARVRVWIRAAREAVGA